MMPFGIRISPATCRCLMKFFMEDLNIRYCMKLNDLNMISYLGQIAWETDMQTDQKTWSVPKWILLSSIKKNFG